MQLKAMFKKIHSWRYKHISQKNFLYALSIVVGLLSGLVSVVIKNITYGIQWLLEKSIILSQNSLYFILPTLGLILVYLILRKFKKLQLGPAIPTILYSLSKKNGILNPRLIYSTLITAPLTVGFGGSVGLLSPAIASASSLSSNIGSLFHLDRRTRMLLIGCASSGVMASIFKSPIAAIVFAVEVFSLDLTFASLLPLLLASVSSVLTSYFFVGDEVLFNFEVSQEFIIKDTFFFVVLGIATAIASIYFSKIYFKVQAFFERFNTKRKKLLIGGLAIGVMLYFIPPLYGEGFSFVNDLLDGNHLKALGTNVFEDYLSNIWVVIALLFGITVFKAVAMTTTLAAGGTGGIIIPTMVMGSALGNVVAKIINNLGLTMQVSEANFTLVGMAGLIAGVLHAPLTAIFLIAEITGGYALFIPLMITVSISFIITKSVFEHSIYTKELAEQGALLTHDKDQSVLTLMNLETVIERNFKTLSPTMSLGKMLHDGVAKSTRNIFPVINNEHQLVGIMLLDHIRDIMFDQSLYNSTTVETFMQAPPDVIYYSDSMNVVMRKFQDSGAWNLPVLKDGCYYGFISKSKLLTAYRRELINFTS